MEKQITLKDKTFELFIRYEEIRQAVRELAARINGDYRGREVPLFLGVLNGSFMFMAELMKEIEFDCEMSFVKLVSYSGTKSTGKVSELIGLQDNIMGRHIIVVEDIVDTGESIDHLMRSLVGHEPASVEVATLLFKPEAYKREVPIKYSALSIPNDFIVGFGLDYDQLGRNLKDIYKIRQQRGSRGRMEQKMIMGRIPEVILEGGRKLPLVEDFYTIQGEGYHTGKPAYFIRLGGCDVGCKWCDAKMTWNPALFPPVDVDRIVERACSFPARAIVITGGEPQLYPMDYMTGRLKEAGLEIFLETSGSQPFSGVFDWVCLSPKMQQAPLPEAYTRADELKVIISAPGDLAWAEETASKTGPGCLLYLQPEWSRSAEITPVIVDYVKANPQWNISVQTHKYMRIP